jgi:tetratricopeptide (TPR) repeat protein
MSYFDGGSSYLSFLQAQTATTHITGEVASRTREIIATKEQLKRHHVTILKSEKEGYDILSCDTRQVGGALVNINESLKQGFAEIVTSLDELKQIARSPSFTWAMEQYLVAKRAFLADWHEEAFSHIRWALNGHANNAGFDLDFRFHFLHGLIRMGAVKAPVAEIVDLAAAERAFLLSAKYAESKTLAVAMGFRCAGWAAYCRGNMEDAINYSRKAVRYDPKLAEAHFQLAKAFMSAGRFDEAARPLRNAICLDVIYLVKSAIDPDFQRNEYALGDTFGSMRRELHEESEKFDLRFAQAERRYKILAQCIKTLTVPFRVSGKEQQQLEAVWAFREEAKAQARTDTIFGHSLAINLNRNAEGLHGLLERIRSRAFEAFDQSIKPLEYILNSRREDMGLFEVIRGVRVWILVLGYVPWMVFWLYVTPTRMPQFLCGSLFVVGWALVVYVGLPIICGLLECILFVPKLIIDSMWEQTIGKPARKRLKELGVLRLRLERAFA